MNIKQLVFMISTLCMFYACEVEDRIIELEPHDSRLVLNAQIYQGDTSSSILLNQSFGITDTLSKDENIAVNKTGRISLFTPDEGVVEGYIYKENKWLKITE